MTQFDFIELAVENNLEIIDTTSECNGYPRNIQKAIVGFETFEEAEELAKKHNLRIEVFKSQDGWNFWYRTGNAAFEPFEREEEDFGDDYFLYEPWQAKNFFKEEVYPRLADETDFDDAEEKMEKFRELYDEICALNDDEAVLVENTSSGPNVIKTISLHSMGYSYDSHNYVIGLIDRNDNEEDDEDEYEE